MSDQDREIVEVRVVMEDGLYTLHVGHYGVTQARNQAEMHDIVVDYLTHHGVQDVGLDFHYALAEGALVCGMDDYQDMVEELIEAARNVDRLPHDHDAMVELDRAAHAFCIHMDEKAAARIERSAPTVATLHTSAADREPTPPSPRRVARVSETVRRMWSERTTDRGVYVNERPAGQGSDGLTWAEQIPTTFDRTWVRDVEVEVVPRALGQTSDEMDLVLGKPGGPWYVVTGTAEEIEALARRVLGELPNAEQPDGGV